MTRPPDSWGESVLTRMDRWGKQSSWLPEPVERFPRNVFLGIFAWNFPILFLAIAVIGTVLYRTDPNPDGTGVFTTLNWIVEVLALAFALAAVIDLSGCLWLRGLWNRRARLLRED